MGEMVSFPSNGDTCDGYVAVPESGSGPGVIVVQEWWGLDSGIKEMADNLADAGFVALAPDLYHGELAGHTEMDRASELMTGSVIACTPDSSIREILELNRDAPVKLPWRVSPSRSPAPFVIRRSSGRRRRRPGDPTAL